MRFILNLIFGRIFKLLDGYKTMIGGVGLIVLGVIGLIGHYWPDLNLPAMDIDKAMTTMSLGFTALGIGGKIEKVIQK